MSGSRASIGRAQARSSVRRLVAHTSRQHTAVLADDRRPGVAGAHVGDDVERRAAVLAVAKDVAGADRRPPRDRSRPPTIRVQRHLLTVDVATTVGHLGVEALDAQHCGVEHRVDGDDDLRGVQPTRISSSPATAWATVATRSSPTTTPWATLELGRHPVAVIATTDAAGSAGAAPAQPMATTDRMAAEPPQPSVRQHAGWRWGVGAQPPRRRSATLDRATAGA